MKTFTKIFFFNIFFLILIEILFGAFFIFRPNPGLSFLFKPFVKYENLDFHWLPRNVPWDHDKNKYKPGNYLSDNNIPYRINSLGFRGPEFNLDKKYDCLGVAYGGSTTIGIDSYFEFTYPELLEKSLSRNGQDCTFLNFGVSSKSLKYIVKRIVQEIDVFNPNYVIIYNNRNSAMYDATTTDIRTDIINSKFNLLIFKLDNLFVNNVMTYKFLKKFIYRLYESTLETPHPSDKRRNINIHYFQYGYFQILDQIYNYLEKRNISLILVKQIYYIDRDIQKKIISNSIQENLNILKKYHKFDLKNNSHSNDLGHYTKYLNYFILTNAILNSQLDEIKKKHNKIIVVDPLETFYKYNSEQISADNIHLKPLGNRILATEITKEMLKSIKSK